MGISIEAIQHRLATLEVQHYQSELAGLDPDSFNRGWLEGAIHELRRLLPSGAPRYLLLIDRDWICPDCRVWIDPTEIGCGCGRIPPT